MKISIIIPANNEEKNIKKCLDSIKKADLPSNVELEIIVNMPAKIIIKNLTKLN